MLVFEFALQIQDEEIVERHVVAISAEHNELTAHKRAAVAVPGCGAPASLARHILVFGWVRGPSKVNLVHAAFTHAL